MATTYESLIPLVREEVPEAPDFRIEDAIRNAAIDLLKDSGLYRTSLTLSLQDGESEYDSSDLGPPSGTRIDHIEQAWYDRRRVEDARYESILRRAGTGPPRYFAPLPDHDGIRVWPEPTASETDSMHFMVTLVPTRDSTDIPDWIADGYEDAIVLRAQYRLFRVRRQPWADPDAAMQRLREYEQKLAEAKRNAMNSRRNDTKVQQRPWV